MTIKKAIHKLIAFSGSGFVTRPVLDILSDAGIEVSVGESPARKTSLGFP